MIFDVAVVRDVGSAYQVEYTTRCDQTIYDVTSSLYVKISGECANAIRTAKANGYPVFIPKGLKNEECNAEQLIIQKTDDLTTAINVSSYRVYSAVNAVLVSINFLDMYKYLSGYAKFAQRGIFVTSENVEEVKKLYTLDETSPDLQSREEAFINILKARSEEDLSALQDFVDAENRIAPVSQQYENMKSVISRISLAETPEQAVAIADEFLTKFNLPSE